MTHSRTVQLMILAALSAAGAAEGRDYYVSPGGADRNGGSRAKPFATIQKAADVMQPGDTCIIRAGLYRQAVRPPRSGHKGRPIRFVAAPGEKVVLDGTEPIAGPWTRHKGRIYTARSPEPFEQLFLDGQMMIEARWPNATFAQLLDRKVWARANKGSRYGKIVDPKLAATGIDWTGALATLNVAHQFFTWSRTVTTHAPGGKTLAYAQDLKGITHYADKTTMWEDDYYVLSGKLEALDAPTEWFRDASGVLYLWTDDGKAPTGRRVAYKKRTYAFEATRRDYIELRGVRFFAATFRFDRCNGCLVEDCRLLFPTFSRRVREFDPVRAQSPVTSVAGQNNTIRRTSLAHASGSGLVMTGRANLVENCIIHDVCWSGSLTQPALAMYGTRRSSEEAKDPAGGSTARQNTLCNAGNAILQYRRGAHTIEYNHVYNGGLLRKDVALVYTGQPSTAGSVVRYNWVHGCWTDPHVGRRRGSRGRPGGLGIRGDDQTRRLSVHHNVVWDCGRDGIIVKGDHNVVANNTVLKIGPAGKPGSSISLHTAPEPKKPWRKQHPLLAVQNANSLIVNNAARTITANQRGKPFGTSKNVRNNCMAADLKLVAPGKLDFRPKPDSPLVDAGRIVKGITDGHKGKAPDVGAYELGGKHWKAGADWKEDK